MINRFAEFEVDRAAYRLERNGEPVRLEPRVFDLLVHLLENHQRVVSKEELFAEVWEGQAVSDSVLTRAVYELRRALGDNSKSPRWIATVHGRGYRFAGEVEDVAEVAGGGRSMIAAALPPSASPQAQPSPPVGGRRRWVSSGLVALVLLAVATGFGLRQLGPEDLPPSSSPQEPLGLLILPFTTSQDDPTLDLLSLSMTDLLWARLSAQPELRVPMPDYTGNRELTTESVGEYLRTLDAKAALTGRLETLDSSRARLTVDLYRVEDSGVETVTLGGYDLPHLLGDEDLARFTRVREAIAASLIQQLGGAFSFSSADGRSPRDPEAYRLYLQARARLLDLTCGDRDWVVDLLDRSLERDPEFSMAWIALGFANYSQLWSCGREAEFAREALAASERALELTPDLPYAVFLQAAVLTDLGRPEEAWRRLHQDPDGRRSPQDLVARAYVLRHVGLIAEAEGDLRRALEFDPLAFEELGEVPVTLLYRGAYDDFLGHLPGVDSPYNLFYRGLTELIRDRPEAARELLEPAFRLNPNDLFARFSSALLAVIDGDRDAAGDIVRQIVHQRRTLGAAGGELTFKEAQLLALVGDHPGAVEQLDLAIEQGFFCPACMAADPLLAPLAADPAFRATVRRAEERQREFLEAVAGIGDLPSPQP